MPLCSFTTTPLSIREDAEAEVRALADPRCLARRPWSVPLPSSNRERQHQNRGGVRTSSLFLNKLLGVYFLKPLENSNVDFIMKDERGHNSLARENFRQ